MEPNKPVKDLSNERRLHQGVVDLMRFTEGYFDRSHRLGGVMVSQAPWMYDVSHRVAYANTDLSEERIASYLERGTQSPKDRVQKRRNDEQLLRRSLLLEDAVDFGQLAEQLKAIEKLKVTAAELAQIEPQIPSIIVLDNSSNHKKAESLGLELLDSSVIMELDIKTGFRKKERSSEQELTFRVERLPFSEDFIEVYRAGFVDNQGFGYNLDEDTVEGLSVFREIEGMSEYAYIAYLGEKPVSIVSISVDDNNKAYVNNVATDPEFRGDGFSRTLMEYTIEDLAAKGVEKVGLYTEIGGLESYYNSIGFESLGVVHNFGAKLQHEIHPTVAQGNEGFALAN